MRLLKVNRCEVERATGEVHPNDNTTDKPGPSGWLIAWLRARPACCLGWVIFHSFSRPGLLQYCQHTDSVVRNNDGGMDSRVPFLVLLLDYSFVVLLFFSADVPETTTAEAYADATAAQPAGEQVRKPKTTVAEAVAAGILILCHSSFDG
ncbi:hypothetical protein TWF694_000744 [Orbilia ellipsospora]|uniref:Uncharacterized protein n=1 Tax=Orbilia ellipsospora TaxID=2528407 RepID=A0AAV9XPH5_9PEZI